MTIALTDFAAGDTDYIAKLNANNTTLESFLNALEALVGGATGLAAAHVPKGLQYIFDRKGLIGKASYKPAAGVLTGPNYNMAVAAGGFWDGGALAYQNTAGTISMSGKSTGTYYLSVDTAGSPSVSTTAGSTSVWQFDYNATTYTVSNVALYTGVAVLFDGADYADALTSAQLGLTFEALADRLEEIEARLVAMGTFYQYDPDTTSGLDFGFKAGQVRNDNVVWSTSADTVILTDDTANYLEVNPADGVVSANTSGFTTGYIPLYEVVTASGAITSATEKRTWAFAGGGGGGGGHVQNTDTGTTSPTFKLNMDETGVPSADCKLEVERGTAANVALKWNEAEGKWQFTNDGTTYQDIFDAAAQLSAQEFTKYVGLDDPDEVLVDTGRSSSVAYESLDLSSYITAPNGLQAVVLRVFFWDSAPAADVNVKFRQKDGASPATAFTVWSDQYGSALLIMPILTDVEVEYFVAASGAGTANIKTYLVGYMEKVTGVGTAYRETTHTGVSVAASSSTTVNITGQANRCMTYYLKVAETGGSMTGTYDIEFYPDDTFTGTPLYKAQAIDPATDYEDLLTFALRDSDLTSEFHVKITNNDGANAGTFDVTLHYEQFA